MPGPVCPSVGHDRGPRFPLQLSRAREASYTLRSRCRVRVEISFSGNRSLLLDSKQRRAALIEAAPKGFGATSPPRVWRDFSDWRRVSQSECRGTVARGRSGAAGSARAGSKPAILGGSSRCRRGWSSLAPPLEPIDQPDLATSIASHRSSTSDQVRGRRSRHSRAPHISSSNQVRARCHLSAQQIQSPGFWTKLE